MSDTNQLATTEQDLPAPVTTPRAVVTSPIAIFDTATFEHLWRVAKAMATSSVIPMSLRAYKENNDWIALPPEQVFGNCLQVVEQAHRWQMSPFAVAQCTSVVHGRLMFEGKLVAAVIDAGLGIKLDFEFGTWNAEKEECVLGNGEGKGDLLAVRVYELIPGSDGLRGRRYVDGCVKHWKTTGNNSPWREGAFKRQLRYRGAREWTRAHEPALLLGVYTDDDRFEIEDEYRAQNAKPVSSGVAARVTDTRPRNGFSAEAIDNELGTQQGGARKDNVIDGEVVEDEIKESETEEQVSTPADETPGATSEPEATSDEESGSRGGVSEPSTSAISEDELQILNSYHRALNRASSGAKLDGLDKEFAKENEGTKLSPAASEVMGQIFNLHADRHDGKIKATEVHEKVQALLGK